jgi:hypothetical protein
MAALPTLYTKSVTRVFKVSNYREKTVNSFCFRGHTWKLAAPCPYDEDMVIFRVRAIPRTRLEKYAQTVFKAKISLEILEEGSGKPVAAFREIKKIAYLREPLFFEETPDDLVWDSYDRLEETICVERRKLEMSSCEHDNGFTYSCTMSEDGTPLGIFSKLRLGVSRIFSKHRRRGYARLRVCPSSEDW